MQSLIFLLTDLQEPSLNFQELKDLYPKTPKPLSFAKINKMNYFIAYVAPDDELSMTETALQKAR